MMMKGSRGWVRTPQNPFLWGMTSGGSAAQGAAQVRTSHRKAGYRGLDSLTGAVEELAQMAQTGTVFFCLLLPGGPPGATVGVFDRATVETVLS
jgi:hypothetical protein